MPYIATIRILIDVEDEADAMDAVAETMREHMRPFDQRSVFRDWMYDNFAQDGELFKVASIPHDFQIDNVWPDKITE